MKLLLSFLVFFLLTSCIPKKGYTDDSTNKRKLSKEKMTTYQKNEWKRVPCDNRFHF
jgi:hypothetical protein